MCPLREETTDQIQNICSVAERAFTCLAKTLTCSALLYYHPYLFTVGFFTGVLFTEEVETRLDRIYQLWNQSWPTKVTLAAFAFLTLPITLCTLSCLSGAGFAAYLMPHSSDESVQTLSSDEP